MNDQLLNSSNKKEFNLEKRTAEFSEKIIDFLKKLPLSPINKNLINQCCNSACSIGANYCEADEAESRKDFKHKIGICKKEIKETLYWLRLVAHANPNFKEEIRGLWKENQELLLIFSAILRSTNKSNK